MPFRVNQLGLRNISEETRRYLIGKRYEMEKKISAFNAVGINQNYRKEVGAQFGHLPKSGETVEKTSERLDKEYLIGTNTVLRYGQCANALDTIAKVVPELHQKLLSGQVNGSI